METLDPCPFRLTRNLTTLLTPFLIEGHFAAALYASTACFSFHQEMLKNYLCVFVRDDILAWIMAGRPARNDSELRQFDALTRDSVSQNVQLILRRHRQLHVDQTPQPRVRPSTHTHTRTPHAHTAAVFAPPAVCSCLSLIVRRLCRVHCSPRSRVYVQSKAQPLNYKAYALIRTATSKTKVSQMPPQWAPWL
jgi:phosphatidylinositol kinase/protein kinase (PI-3  family)